MTHFFNDPFGMRCVMDYAEGIDEVIGLNGHEGRKFLCVA